MVTFCQQVGLGEGGHCATLISNIYFVYTARISSEVDKLFCGSFQDSVEFLVNEIVL